MLCTVKLEAVGDDVMYIRYMHSKYGFKWIPRNDVEAAAGRPWVAKIVGLDQRFGFRREFVHGQRDYYHADDLGARGIWIYFHLDDGLYEVNELPDWNRIRRYYLKVVSGKATEIRLKEVAECLRI